MSELQVVRHFTRLSQLNYSIDGGFYPLGSCTMKYNPKLHESVVANPRWSALHPHQPDATVQGVLALLYRLQELPLCNRRHGRVHAAAGGRRARRAHRV